LEIVNALGEVVINVSESANLEKLNISKLPNGVYFVKTKGDLIRFIKQ
jgi:hypothetical protein